MDITRSCDEFVIITHNSETRLTLFLGGGRSQYQDENKNGERRADQTNGNKVTKHIEIDAETA